MPPAYFARLVIPDLGLVARAEVNTHMNTVSTNISETVGNGTYAGQLIKQAESHWNVTSESILIAWGLTLVGSILVILLYSSLRQNHPTIYAPRVRFHRDNNESIGPKFPGVFVPGVPVVPLGYLAWLKPLWRDLKAEMGLRTSKRVRKRDIEMMKLLGFDAVTFLQFMRLLRWLFLVVSALVAVPLICVNYFLNTHTDYGVNPDTIRKAANEVNASAIVGDLQLITAGNIKGNGLYVHVTFELFITLLVVVFVLNHASHHKELVEQWASMNFNEIAFKTVLLTNLNIKHLDQFGNKVNIQAIHQQLKSVLGVSASADVQINIVQKSLSALEDKIRKYSDEAFVKLDLAVAAVLRGEHTGQYEGWSCWAVLKGDTPKTEQDVIKNTAKEKEIVEQELKEAKKTLQAQHCDRNVTTAFITFNTAKKAHDAVNARREKSLKKNSAVKAQVAPRSRNLEYENLAKDPLSIGWHIWVGRGALFILWIFNTIPLMMIQLIANLNAASEVIPWLKSLRDSSGAWKVIFSAISGVAPPAIAAMSALALPYIMRFLARWSGSIHTGELDRKVVAQMFIFQLASNFIVFSLLGVLYETYLNFPRLIGVSNLEELTNNLGEIFAKIARAYISESSFWLSWFPIRSAMLCVQLLQIPRWAMKAYELFFTYREGLTPNTGYKFGTPLRFEYAIDYTHILFAMCVAMIYAPLAPLVVMCGTIYFWIASIVFANHLTFVLDTKETDGQLWKLVIDRLLVATVLMQILMTLTVALKTRSVAITLLAFSQTAIIALLKYYLKRHFGDFAQFLQEIPTSKNLSTPKYVFDILKTDWMPKFKCNPRDLPKLRKLAQENPGLAEVIPELKGSEGKKKKKKKKKTWREKFGGGHKKEHREHRGDDDRRDERRDGRKHKSNKSRHRKRYDR